MAESEAKEYGLNSKRKQQSLKITLINKEQILISMNNKSTNEKYINLVSMTQLKKLCKAFNTAKNMKEIFNIIKNAIKSRKMILIEDPKKSSIKIKFNISLSSGEEVPFHINLSNKEESIKEFLNQVKNNDDQENKKEEQEIRNNNKYNTIDNVKPIAKTNIKPIFKKIKRITKISQDNSQNEAKKNRVLSSKNQIGLKTRNNDGQFPPINNSNSINKDQKMEIFSPIRKYLNKSYSINKESINNNSGQTMPSSQMNKNQQVSEINQTDFSINNQGENNNQNFSEYSNIKHRPFINQSEDYTSQNKFFLNKSHNFKNTGFIKNSILLNISKKKNKMEQRMNNMKANYSYMSNPFILTDDLNLNKSQNFYQINQTYNPFQSNPLLSDNQYNSNNNNNPNIQDTMLYGDKNMLSPINRYESLNKTSSQKEKILFQKIKLIKNLNPKNISVKSNRSNQNLESKFEKKETIAQNSLSSNHQHQQDVQNLHNEILPLHQKQTQMNNINNSNNQKIKENKKNLIKPQAIKNLPSSHKFKKKMFKKKSHTLIRKFGALKKLSHSKNKGLKKTISSQITPQPPILKREISFEQIALAHLASLKNEDNPYFKEMETIYLPNINQAPIVKKPIIQEMLKTEGNHLRKINQRELKELKLKESNENENEFEDKEEEINEQNQAKQKENLNIENLYFNSDGKVIFRNGLLRGVIHNYAEIDDVVSKIQDILAKGVKFNLVYKAFDLDDRAQTFHEKCDNLKNSLILIETSKDIRFGGFTTKSWKGNCIKKFDKNAFVFTIGTNKIFNVFPHQPAIGCYPRYGPVFFGCQIRIFDEFFKNGGTTCYKGLNYNTNFDFELNNGEQRFLVKDIEVYSLE